MLLLALDTSTSAITAALHDGTSVWSRSREGARGHAEWLAVIIAEILASSGRAPAEVTHVVAGEGPGPFTGLRAGLATAEAFAFATGAAYSGVCSLDVLAAAAVLAGSAGPGAFAVATDARRKEVYWAGYEFSGEPGPGADLSAGLRRTSEPAVARPASLPAHIRGLPCAGRGPRLYPQDLPRAAGPLDADAAALAELALARLASGELVPGVRARPRYLRRPDARPAPASSLLAPGGRA